MSQAITLFLLAIKLLTLVQGTPNLPDAVRTQAITIANQAIAEANSELAVSQTTPIITGTVTAPVSVPVPISAPAEIAPAPVQTPQPIITQPNIKIMEDKSAVTATIVQTTPADKVNSIPYGSYIIQVRVLAPDGVTTINSAPVNMAAPNNLYGDSVSKQIDTRQTPGSTDYYTSFEYIPKTKGNKTITFTSGELTSTLDISVN